VRHVHRGMKEELGRLAEQLNAEMQRPDPGWTASMRSPGNNGVGRAGRQSPEDVRIPVWVASEHARIVELHHLVHHLAEVVGSAEHEGGRQ
jgi:hypothetical protein